MATAAAPTPDPALQQAAWNLDPLVAGEGEQGVRRLLDEALVLGEGFAQRYAGEVAALDGAGLVAAMRELERIHTLLSRAGHFASLRFSTDTADPAVGALLQHVQERETEIATRLLFFELEWTALDDARAEELLGADGLDFARHHLRMERRYRPHRLSEPEEKILAEKQLSGATAWARFFAEHTSAIEVELEGEAERVPLDVALSRLEHPDRALRAATQEAVTKALAPGLRTRAYIFNTLLHDKAVDDRLRSFPSWITSRNLSNEVSDAAVEALVDAVRARYDLPQRWYRLKAQLLGIDRLADYDRAAAVTQDDESFGYEAGRQVVLDSFGDFSGELADIARRFFDERWIDAPPRPAKRGGAFCAPGVPELNPYVMLNWTGRRRDVLTLAHELGHGLHFALAARQGIIQQGTPLTVAETASVFGETLVFNRLLGESPDASSKLALLASNVEDSIATVFRQTAMNRFEHAVHSARREQGELSVDRFGELWAETQADLFGDSVEVTDNYRSWWSYIPHFVNTPGYVYAYAFGQLLALSVYQRYVDEGEAFVPAYIEMLAAGGSRSPEELGRIVGIDLEDPGFWDRGLALVEKRIGEAEAAAAEAGRV